jgi:hypothetical protein
MISEQQLVPMHSKQFTPELSSVLQTWAPRLESGAALDPPSEPAVEPPHPTSAQAKRATKSATPAMIRIGFCAWCPLDEEAFNDFARSARNR